MRRVTALLCFGFALLGCCFTLLCFALAGFLSNDLLANSLVAKDLPRGVTLPRRVK